ncbi:Polynucleotidyl transferase isoform 2 [Theobroma cacao]|uniref:RNA exonuclease 4 n=2 Tax=Theobroma cacao TaxID=3641 RepID=A0A061F8E5_THECC|nr:Polynucleotidyl transferase isoform 2 [Theobroma cacao]
MGSDVKKNPKQFQLNPNWAQLQQKLKSAETSRHPKIPQSETPNSILGKRKERPTPESDDAKPNPLIPTNDDSSLTDVLAMDCEMVGVGQGNKSALGRVSLVNKWGNVIYDEFVRPIERVVDFRTQISGIRPRDLKKAKDFRAVQKKVAELIKGRILVGHALHNDLKALLLTHPKKDLRDTSEYQPFLKEGRRKALRHLAAEVLGVEIQNGEHCPAKVLRMLSIWHGDKTPLLCSIICNSSQEGSLLWKNIWGRKTMRVLRCFFTRKTERNGRRVLRIK